MKVRPIHVLVVAVSLLLFHFLRPRSKPFVDDSLAVAAPKSVAEELSGDFESFRSRIDAIQGTPTGWLHLGTWFFRRANRVSGLDDIEQAVVDLLRTQNVSAIRSLTVPNSIAAIRDSERPMTLAEWWERRGGRIPDPFETQEFPAARDRFETLAARVRLTSDEQVELKGLVVKCGRDWLRIPFDERAQRFDLQTKLPEQSPEVACLYYSEIYEAMTGRLYRKTRSMNDLYGEVERDVGRQIEERASDVHRSEPTASTP